jgi:hypothetical protein
VAGKSDSHFVPSSNCGQEAEFPGQQVFAEGLVIFDKSPHKIPSFCSWRKRRPVFPLLGQYQPSHQMSWFDLREVMWIDVCVGSPIYFHKS